MRRRCSASKLRVQPSVIRPAASQTGSAGALLARSAVLPLAVVAGLGASELLHTKSPGSRSRGASDLSPEDSNRIITEQEEQDQNEDRNPSPSLSTEPGAAHTRTTPGAGLVVRDATGLLVGAVVGQYSHDFARVAGRFGDDVVSFPVNVEGLTLMPGWE